MGMYAPDEIIAEIVERLNWRFSAENVGEIAELQRAGQVFSPNRSMTVSFSLIGLLPIDANRSQIDRIFAEMRMMPSDLPGVSGYERMFRAIRDSLELSPPFAIQFTKHSVEDRRLIVISKLLEPTVISYPAMSRSEAKQQIREQVEERRASRVPQHG